jgi:hypothetical protein
MLPQRSSLIDHLVVDAAIFLFIVAVFALSGPVASLIPNASEQSVGSAIGSIGVFVGFLVYRRMWAVRRRP